jgi:hypothetical protein
MSNGLAFKHFSDEAEKDSRLLAASSTGDDSVDCPQKESPADERQATGFTVGSQRVIFPRTAGICNDLPAWIPVAARHRRCPIAASVSSRASDTTGHIRMHQ